jgi:uncharacterized membrane protein
MSEGRDLFLYAASYPDEETAQLDYEAVKNLHAEGVIGTYDAAIVYKDAEGKVHVHKHEKPTQHGAWTGVAVGAVVGVIFPPSVIGAAVVGGAAGGLIGHFRGGLSRDDAKEIASLVDEDGTVLLVVGQSKLEEYIDKAITHAQRQLQKQVKGDIKDFDKALAEAEKQS